MSFDNAKIKLKPIEFDFEDSNRSNVCITIKMPIKTFKIELDLLNIELISEVLSIASSSWIYAGLAKSIPDILSNVFLFFNSVDSWTLPLLSGLILFLKNWGSSKCPIEPNGGFIFTWDETESFSEIPISSLISSIPWKRITSSYF